MDPELVGLAASALILVSLLLTSVVRLRIVNVDTARVMMLGIEGAEAFVVAVDGTVLATFGVAVLAIRVGEAGGELVYRHGAATAYASGAGGTAPLSERGSLDRDDDD